MAVKNLEFPKFRYTVVKTDANGNSYLSPASGYKVYTYEAGTTTPLTTYSDFDLTTPNANPIILGADGSANIFFDESIKIDLLSDVDVRVTGFPVDDIPTGEEVTVTGNFNAVLNGDFEISTNSLPDNWTLSPYSNGTILIDTTAATSGKQSLKFTGAGSGGGTATSTIFDVSANEDILVEFSYKASAAASTNIVTVYWYKLDGTASATASTTVHTDSATNPSSFTTYRYSVDVPSDATQATLAITGVSSGGGQLTSNANFDNIRVITSSYLVPDTIGTVQANKVVTAGAGGAIAGAILTSPVLNGTLSGTAFLDEDAMTSNSAIAVPSQQSVKAYVDNSISNYRSITLGTPVSLSGLTSIDITSIPSEVKRIDVLFAGVSVNTASEEIIMQIGDSGGIETSGYDSSTNSLSVIQGSITAFILTTDSPVGDTNYGILHLYLQNESTNTWVMEGSLGGAGDTRYWSVGGKSLTGVLDRLRITTASGTTQFDSGTVNINYSR